MKLIKSNVLIRQFQSDTYGQIGVIRIPSDDEGVGFDVAYMCEHDDIFMQFAVSFDDMESACEHMRMLTLDVVEKVISDIDEKIK